MENASKALAMAGGVLIAIMVIALAFLLFNNLSESRQTDEEMTKAKQTAEFNREFESYNKKMLLGTDLATVINKARANNEKYEDDDKSYHINIKFILSTPITEVEVKVENGKRKEPKTTTIFAKDLEYSLIKYVKNQLVTNENIVNLIDIGAIDIKEIINCLNTITGENATEDIINEIFKKFCLGK